MEKKSMLEIFKQDQNYLFLNDLIKAVHGLIGSYPATISGYIGVADIRTRQMFYKKIGEVDSDNQNENRRTVINSLSISLLKLRRQEAMNQVDLKSFKGITLYKDIFVVFAGLSSGSLIQAISLSYAIYLYELERNRFKTFSPAFCAAIALTLANEYANSYSDNKFLRKLSEHLPTVMQIPEHS